MENNINFSNNSSLLLLLQTKLINKISTKLCSENLIFDCELLNCRFETFSLESNLKYLKLLYSADTEINGIFSDLMQLRDFIRIEKELKTSNNLTDIKRKSIIVNTPVKAEDKNIIVRQFKHKKLVYVFPDTKLTENQSITDPTIHLTTNIIQ